MNVKVVPVNSLLQSAYSFCQTESNLLAAISPTSSNFSNLHFWMERFERNTLGSQKININLKLQQRLIFCLFFYFLGNKWWKRIAETNVFDTTFRDSWLFKFPAYITHCLSRTFPLHFLPRPANLQETWKYLKSGESTSVIYRIRKYDWNYYQSKDLNGNGDYDIIFEPGSITKAWFLLIQIITFLKIPFHNQKFIC